MKNQLLKRRKERIVKGQVKHIMDSFDFEKVHKSMTILGLGWRTRYNSKVEVPALDALKTRANDMLMRAGDSDDEWSYIEMGGFVASKYPNGEMTLQFAIESCSELP